MNLSKQVESLILQMSVFAKEHNHEFVTPEHLLYVMLSDKDFSAAFKNCQGMSPSEFRKNMLQIDRNGL